MDAVGVWGATGCEGNGIGKEIVNKLLLTGNKNVHIFGRDRGKLESLKKTYSEIKGLLPWDIETENKTKLYQEYLIRNGITTVISAVGMGRGDKLPALTRRDLTEMTMSNFVVPAIILKSTLSPLKGLHGGRIMMFGSIASVKPTEGISGYAGTKTGLKGFIDSARYELRDTFPEVSIHGIYPTTVHHVGIDSVLNAVLYLMKIKFGVHADIVLSLV